MKADVTAPDCLERDYVKVATPNPKAEDDRRRARRVPIKLRMSIALKGHANMAESVDISESGVLVENYGGPELRRGKEVHATIKGVISDGDTIGQIVTMYVAWVADKRVAFTFCPY